MNRAGTAVIANGRDGVVIGSSNNHISENIISGNARIGILTLSPSTNTQITNNFIGTDVAGTLDFGNASDGVQLQTAGHTVQNNVISGNNQHGVPITASANIVVGNTIGADISGTIPLANTLSGVHIVGSSDSRIGGTTFGHANIIAFNLRAGISVELNSLRNALLSDAIFSNGGLGIDLANDSSVRVNDNLDADTGPNAFQNYPIVTANISN